MQVDLVVETRRKYAENHLFLEVCYELCDRKNV